MTPEQMGTETTDSRPWFERVMRWGQLTLVEDDPVKYDENFWLDYFERTRCDGVCLSAGGYVAYYPTDVPLHHRSRWLGDGDAFGSLVAGAGQEGMAVLARTDPHAVHQPVFDAHPDWIAVDADGAPRRHWSATDAWVACALGPYNFDYMPRRQRRDHGALRRRRHLQQPLDRLGHVLLRALQPELPRSLRDGPTPLHRSPGPGPQGLHRLAAATPVRPVPALGHRDPGGEPAREVRSELRRRRVERPGHGVFGEIADTPFADRQGRSGIVTPWAAGKNAKEYRATMGKKAVGGIFSVGLEGAHRWKDSTQSDDEIRVWVADSIANGMRPWFTKFAGVVHDGRWLPVVEDIYRWHHKWEHYFRDQVPLARVGVVYSQQTAKFYAGPRRGTRSRTTSAVSTRR